LKITAIPTPFFVQSQTGTDAEWLPPKNLREARMCLKAMPFEILISDFNLSDGEGLELLREAKKLQPIESDRHD
jgi:DNA-binding NtrC family response regulator